MSSLWIVLVVVVFLVVVAVLVRARLGGLREVGASYKAKQLLTENEKEFFHRLKRALPGYEVFPQVAMGSVLAPNVDRGDRRYHQIRGTFSQKIIDFLICDGETLKVVAIVELDDRTHNAERDEKRDAMLKSAKYRVLRWHSKKKPSEAEIRARVIGTKPEAVVPAQPSQLQVVDGGKRS